MKYKCIIIDDEAQARKLIETYVSKIPELELIASCKTALEGQAIISENKIDILFLDINMPELSGIDFLKLSKNTPATILITAYSEYALNGYELDIVDYLIKPVEFGRFYQAVLKAFEKTNKYKPNVKTKAVPAGRQDEKDVEYLFVKADKEIIKVKVSEIQYIEGMREYVRINMDKRKIVTLQSLSKFSDILPKDTFFRVHKSYIVNIQAIDNIIGNTIYIQDNRIPISRGHRKEFMDLINKNNMF